ncbi:hypothetical protein FPV67DRAFT_1501321 [Lyophyllum atratum]|nr:hypothetical protein FPV67DRAFT_1501321 [Lyophyllum atratum]
MAAAASPSQQPSDPWDLPTPPSSSSRRPPAPVQPVPDDWDDDDAEEPEQDNQRIWEDANAKAPNPMPALIIAPSATSPHPVLSPPPGAFLHTMRILKRPSNSSNPSTPPPNSTSTESLKEREARYQAARERIFGAGEESPPASANASSQSLSSKDKRERRGPNPQNSQGVAVVRNPRGPAGANDGRTPPRGFGEQRIKPPPVRDETAAGRLDSR